MKNFVFITVLGASSALFFGCRSTDSCLDMCADTSSSRVAVESCESPCPTPCPDGGKVIVRTETSESTNVAMSDECHDPAREAYLAKLIRDLEAEKENARKLCDFDEDAKKRVQDEHAAIIARLENEIQCEKDKLNAAKEAEQRRMEELQKAYDEAIARLDKALECEKNNLQAWLDKQAAYEAECKQKMDDLLARLDKEIECLKELQQLDADRREACERKLERPSGPEKCECPADIMREFANTLARLDAERMKNLFTNECWSSCGERVSKTFADFRTGKKTVSLRYAESDLKVVGDRCHVNAKLCIKDSAGQEEIRDFKCTLGRCPDDSWKIFDYNE